MSTNNFDIIVIGSGILGSALACTLARQGRNVAVIERDLSEPNRIVGELLQPGGVVALAKLGMAECLEGFDAHTIRGYVIHDTKTGSTVQLEYPPEDGAMMWGKAFHHGKFIQSLRKVAIHEEKTTFFEGTAKELIEEDNAVIGVEFKDRASGEVKTLRAPLTIVADGCFSKFRKQLVSEEPTVPSHFAGIILKDCPQAKDNHAELCLMEPSPVLIYQISSNETRCLVDIKGPMPRDMQAYLIDVIAPNLPEHIRPSFLEAARLERPRCMPNSWLPPVPIIKAGVLCLGDAVNMRHPLTGGGMTVAFNDVVLFRDIFEQLDHFNDHKAVMTLARELYSQRRMQQSFVVNVLSLALYKLFAADDVHVAKLKEACFEYFKLGGDCVQGPVSLLSIMNPRPKVLLTHFFSVALYAVYQQFKQEPWWAVHRSCTSSAGIMWKAGCIILPLMWGEIKSMKA